MDNKPSSPSWETVERFLSEKTNSGNLMALVETEKIFEQVLEKLDFPGKTADEKAEGLKFIIKNFNELKIARKNYHQIISQPNFSLTPEEIEKLLTYYYKAIEQIALWQEKKQNILIKIKIKAATYLTNPKESLKKAAIFTIAFFFIIFLLDSTKVGRWFVGILVKISHFIFSWLLFAVLLIIGIIIIALGVIIYLDSRKKEKIKSVKNSL